MLRGFDPQPRMRHRIKPSDRQRRHSVSQHLIDFNASSAANDSTTPLTDLLIDDDVVTARTGDLLVVPPGVAHAFGAHRDSTAEALIIATPEIERDASSSIVDRRA
jgi:hypothetical protein